MIFWQKTDFVQNYFLVFLPNYASHDFDSSVQKVFKLILLKFIFYKKIFNDEISVIFWQKIDFVQNIFRETMPPTTLTLLYKKVRNNNYYKSSFINFFFKYIYYELTKNTLSCTTKI